MNLIKVAVLLTSCLASHVHSSCTPTQAPPTCSGGWVWGPASLPPSCPAVQYITNFGLEKACGGWYRAFTTRDASAAGCRGDCITLFVAPYDGTNYIATECCRQGINLNNICNPDVGSGTINEDPDIPGVIDYIINGVTIKLYILDADNDLTKYAIVYSCTTDCQGNKVEFVDVLTRNVYTSPEDEAYYYSVLAGQGVDIDKVKAVSQYVGCPYTFYSNN